MAWMTENIHRFTAHTVDENNIKTSAQEGFLEKFALGPCSKMSVVSSES